MEQHERQHTYYEQTGFDARFEWGADGVRRLAPISDVVVIVDVLSFSTCVDVAVGRGATVFPYRWRDEGASEYAQSNDALLAAHRGQTTPEQPYSLSPQSLQMLPAGTRLVLPSPNGSALSFLAANSGATVIAGCLRNATAVGAMARTLGNVVTVIAAGERWDAADEPLRPAVEDMIGAGAILAALRPTSPSPEAIAAIAAFAAVVGDPLVFLAACSSGRELSEKGYQEDVIIAAARDASAAVPILRDGAFTDAA